MSAGSTPDFDCSPARFTCTSAGTSSRRAAESESSECTSSQVRFTTFTLFDCRCPMKCHAKASPYSAAATTVTSGPTSACTRASRSRIVSGDGTEHALHAAREPVAPVREEEVWMVARAEVDPLDPVHAGPPQRALRRRPQVEPAVDGEVVVEERRHLRPDLVAARPDRRPHDRREIL